MKRRINTLILMIIMLSGSIGILISGCTKDPEQTVADKILKEAVPSASQAGQQYVTNEMLVKFKAGTSENARKVALSKINGSVAEIILTNAMKHSGDNEGVTLVKMPMAVLDAVNRLKGSAEIEYAEPNFIYTSDATSNDHYYTNG